MSCDKVVKEICDELAEDIDSQLCSRLREHLSTCSDCAEQVSAMRNTIHLFRDLQREDVPESIHERLIKLLNV